MNKYTCCTWAGGTFFLVVLLCQLFVLGGNRFWFYILTYVIWQIILRTNIFLIVVEVLPMFFGGFFCQSNWDRKEKGTVVWPLVGINLISLSVVSKYEHHQSHFNLVKFLLGFFILQKQWDPNFLLLCIPFLLCIDLQPYSHDRFSKISRTFFASRN